MSATILPFLDRADDPIAKVAARIGPVLLPRPPPPSIIPPEQYYILVDQPSLAGAHHHHHPPPSVAELTSWLDNGADKIIVPLTLAKEVVGVLPPERLIVMLDADRGASAVSDRVRKGVAGVLVKMAPTMAGRSAAAGDLDMELVASVARFFAGGEAYVLLTSRAQASDLATMVRELRRRADAALVVPAAQLTLGESTPARVNIADAFLAPLTSDRADGLFPTVVADATLHGGAALGLVYSSAASAREAILSGEGVYQSRHREGLWRKGATSGATQDVVRVRVDCDADCLLFDVVQHGAGFCHRGTHTCFGGGGGGLAALERTLQSRRDDGDGAPEGSYTKRLLGDAALLRAKLMEEVDELCAAQTPADIAFEAADLLYFALVKCVAHGVTLADVERSLDKKARKATRRPGNAKPQWVATTAATPSPRHATQPSSSSSSSSEEIRMQTADLRTVSPPERAQLLRRPVLKSDEMLAKVRPIVGDVRARGDAALLEYVARFDKVSAPAPAALLIRPPFLPAAAALDADVRRAMDTAYANIRRFHEAQTTEPGAGGTLTVETMPGVVCSRFARPIARVGLYVPGGTAVLPSTALMLGVPAQVAGCREIVLATPPRADGTLAPEVAYAAHLVGASGVLAAGGAHAVAALAYGTRSVPKVDKIFGPGNQWVTAAKMLVQNDTDALVSIDMPAGPSEVLVIADDTATPSFVAADLLSQAEHGVDSQVVLVAAALSDVLLHRIEHEIDEQTRALPQRADIVRVSLRKSVIVMAASVEEAFEFANDYAPEHLILHVRDAAERVGLVQNAGSVFVGPFSPESCGDYASGTNHTLPTNGYARQFSGVNTLSFQKHITCQQVTKAGLDVLGPVVVTLAECEGLYAHANAVRVRLENSEST